MLLSGIFFVLEDLSQDVPPGGLDVLLALYEFELHHGRAGLVQARPGCGLRGVLQRPGEDGLHGGDGSLQADLDVPVCLTQPRRAQRCEQVAGPCRCKYLLNFSLI